MHAPNASRAPRSANNANDGPRKRVPRDELAVRLMADEATINAAMRRQRWQSSDLRERQRTATPTTTTAQNRGKGRTSTALEAGVKRNLQIR